MYEELVKELRNKYRAYIATDNERPGRLFRDAADAIEQLQAECQDWYKAYMDLLPTRWYSVEECLPEPMKYVLLVIRRMGKEYCRDPFISTGYLSVNKVSWWCSHDGSCSANRVEVTHWMPLPALPTPVMEYPQVEGITPTVITPDEHSPVYESIKRGLEQAISGETREGGREMTYDELVRRLRETPIDMRCAKVMREAADAIEELVQVRDHQRDILMQFGGETGIRQAFERMGDYWRLADKYEELLKAAKKMHTWIFLHTGDEQKVYDECGLSEDMNIALGYSGQIEFRAQKPEEERGCPPDYNPGFCYGDEDCDACWEGWRKEQVEP